MTYILKKRDRLFVAYRSLFHLNTLLNHFDKWMTSMNPFQLSPHHQYNQHNYDNGDGDGNGNGNDNRNNCIPDNTTSSSESTKFTDQTNTTLPICRKIF